MKLDHDLVRTLLLAIEATDDPTGMDPQEAAVFMKETDISKNVLAYHIARLKEADFITGRVVWASDEPAVLIPGNLTYKGHEYLDNVRAPEVWRQTKATAKKVGSVSLEIMSQIGASIILKTLGLS